jgi:hypothetical protein
VPKTNIQLLAPVRHHHPASIPLAVTKHQNPEGFNFALCVLFGVFSHQVKDFKDFEDYNPAEAERWCVSIQADTFEESNLVLQELFDTEADAQAAAVKAFMLEELVFQKSP